MEKKSLVSIIIPVYNVEKFVKESVLSAITQTYQNLEIVVVNDGSTDNSSKICHELEKKDNRVKVYDKENGGVSSARNFGVEHAKGEYLMFLDGDDRLTANAVEGLLEVLQREDADICIGKGITISEKDTMKPKPSSKNSFIKVLTPEEAIENALYEADFSFSCNIKIYKKNVFKNISFPNGRTFEDLATIYKVFLNCKKIVYTKFNMYYYILRSGSIVSSLNPLKNIDFFVAAQEVQGFIEANYPNILKAANYKVFSAALELFVKYPPSEKQLSSQNKKDKKNIWNIIKKYRTEILINKKSRTKYRILAFVSYFGQTTLSLFYKSFAKR